jgi:hypothetical protein
MRLLEDLVEHEQNVLRFMQSRFRRSLLRLR